MIPQALQPKTSTNTLKALYAALTDPRTPTYAKIIPLLVLVYGLFPFDLLPDFIPFIGWIDDALLIPAGIWLALRLIPADVIRDVGASLGQTVEAFKRTLLWISISVVAIIVILGIALVSALVLLVRATNT